MGSESRWLELEKKIEMERRMDNMIKKFRLGELFCGPGGLALGAIQASDCMEYVLVLENKEKHFYGDSLEG